MNASNLVLIGSASQIFEFSRHNIDYQLSWAWTLRHTGAIFQWRMDFNASLELLLLLRFTYHDIRVGLLALRTTYSHSLQTFQLPGFAFKNKTRISLPSSTISPAKPPALNAQLTYYFLYRQHIHCRDRQYSCPASAKKNNFVWSNKW